MVGLLSIGLANSMFKIQWRVFPTDNHSLWSTQVLPQHRTETVDSNNDAREGLESFLRECLGSGHVM
jgi:hypothetical protein